MQDTVVLDGSHELDVITEGGLALEAILDGNAAAEAVLDGDADLSLAMDGGIAVHIEEDGEFGTFIQTGGGDYPVYTGPTEVTPSQQTQTLGTRGKAVLSDIKVNPIPSNYGLITWTGSVLTVT